MKAIAGPHAKQTAQMLVTGKMAPHTGGVKKKSAILEILGTPKARDGLRLCDAPECGEFGEFRAPRSKTQLTNYYWFCLVHVRGYNAQWNFYSGFSRDDIEKQIRSDTTWRRPTWPLGLFGAQKKMAPGGPGINFGAFGPDSWDQTYTQAEEVNGDYWRPRPGSEEEDALAVFDLKPPVTIDIIRTRYKTLVKRNHPDANGGNKESEERLKNITRAYAVLRKSADKIN